jgi:hypothetical protein
VVDGHGSQGEAEKEAGEMLGVEPGLHGSAATVAF